MCSSCFVKPRSLSTATLRTPALPKLRPIPARPTTIFEGASHRVPHPFAFFAKGWERMRMRPPSPPHRAVAAALALGASDPRSKEPEARRLRATALVRAGTPRTLPDAFPDSRAPLPSAYSARKEQDPLRIVRVHSSKFVHRSCTTFALHAAFTSETPSASKSTRCEFSS